MKSSDDVARAIPMAAFNSSIAPHASTRGWFFGTRRPYINPVVPKSPVFVTMLTANELRLKLCLCLSRKPKAKLQEQSISGKPKSPSQSPPPFACDTPHHKFFCLRSDLSCSRLQLKSLAFARRAKWQTARAARCGQSRLDFARAIFGFDTRVANFCPRCDLQP